VLALVPVIQQWATTRILSAGLSVRQYIALETIHQGATSPGDIARLWQVTPGGLTGIIDRLEGRGLVRRETDPADRRRAHLVMTVEGDATRVRIGQELATEFASQLATASADELAALDTALAVLQRTLAALRDDSGTGQGDEAGTQVADYEPEIA
jgi:DNA-binding MarR family transcriptional regulator